MSVLAVNRGDLCRVYDTLITSMTGVLEWTRLLRLGPRDWGCAHHHRYWRHGYYRVRVKAA